MLTEESKCKKRNLYNNYIFTNNKIIMKDVEKPNNNNYIHISNSNANRRQNKPILKTTVDPTAYLLSQRKREPNNYKRKKNIENNINKNNSKLINKNNRPVSSISQDINSEIPAPYLTNKNTFENFKHMKKNNISEHLIGQTLEKSNVRTRKTFENNYYRTTLNSQPQSNYNDNFNNNYFNKIKI